MDNYLDFTHTIHEVKIWIRKHRNRFKNKKNHDKFNSVTQKITPENQNQTHNSRKEGIQPINQKR